MTLYEEDSIGRIWKREADPAVRLAELARRAEEDDRNPPTNCFARVRTVVDDDGLPPLPRYRDAGTERCKIRPRGERRVVADRTVIDILSGRQWESPSVFAREFKMSRTGVVTLLHRNKEGCGWKAQRKFELWYLSDAIAAGKVEREFAA